MKAYIVKDNDDIIVATYSLEGNAKKFCKDRGYSYAEYVDTESVDTMVKDLLLEIELLHTKYSMLHKYYTTQK